MLEKNDASLFKLTYCILPSQRILEINEAFSSLGEELVSHLFCRWEN